MSLKHLITDRDQHEEMFQSSRSVRYFGDKLHKAIQYERYDIAEDALEELERYLDKFSEQLEKAPDWIEKVREAKT